MSSKREAHSARCRRIGAALSAIAAILVLGVATPRTNANGNGFPAGLPIVKVREIASATKAPNGTITARSAEASGKKAPKFSRAAAQRAATRAAPRLLVGQGADSYADADGSYTETYGPEQLVALYGCSKALALHGDAFGCHMVVQRSRTLTAATGIYVMWPPNRDGTETLCSRLTLGLYQGKTLPPEFTVDPDFGKFPEGLTVPFKKPYKVLVSKFYESCP